MKIMARSDESMNAPSDSDEVRELSMMEIDDVAGAGWLRDAYNWVKKHVTRGPGDYGIAVKGTHDIGK
jgi:hypothetical protein